MTQSKATGSLAVSRRFPGLNRFFEASLWPNAPRMLSPKNVHDQPQDREKDPFDKRAGIESAGVMALPIELETHNSSNAMVYAVLLGEVV